MKLLFISETLDNVEEIKRVDQSGMLETCLKADRLAVEAVKLAEKMEFPVEYRTPRNIIVLGMGGSAISGELLKDWLWDKSPIPIETCNNYWLPAYVDENSLVFTLSYSGNTEETLYAFFQAYKRKCKLFAITSGGYLREFCRKLKVPYLPIPGGLAPRAALPYMFFPLAFSMEKIGLISDLRREIDETLAILRKISKENHFKKPFSGNIAKKLAFKLYGAIPVIYGFGCYAAVAHRWKTQINENSKLPCKYEVFPELNHNEVVGWEASARLTSNFTVVLLRDPFEPPEIRERIELTKSLTLKNVREVLEVEAEGSSRLAKMFSLLHLGDLVSVYLAILHGKNPTPVKNIDKIKRGLKKRLKTLENLKREVDRLV